MNINLSNEEQAVIWMSTKSKSCHGLFEEYRLGLAAEEDMDDKHAEVLDCVHRTLEASKQCIEEYETFGQCVTNKGLFAKCQPELKVVENCVLANKKPPTEEEE